MSSVQLVERPCREPKKKGYEQMAATHEAFRILNYLFIDSIAFFVVNENVYCQLEIWTKLLKHVLNMNGLGETLDSLQVLDV